MRAELRLAASLPVKLCAATMTPVNTLAQGHTYQHMKIAVIMICSFIDLICKKRRSKASSHTPVSLKLKPSEHTFIIHNNRQIIGIT